MKSDSRLVEECLNGNQRAWVELINRYQRFIYTVIIRCGLDRNDADDVFQSVCLSWFQHLGSLQDTERLSSWLAAVTRQQVCRHIRTVNAVRRGGGATTVSLDDCSIAAPISTNQEVDAELLDLERQTLLTRAIGELPEQCQQIITLLYMRNPPLTYSELTEQLSIPGGSIGPTRARCLEKLKKILGKYGYDEYLSL